MNIIVSNQAKLSNKYVRQIKWRMHNLKEKFDDLLYAEVFFKVEGQKPSRYIANVRLGVTGYDIIIRNKSLHPQHLLHLVEQDAHRYLAARSAAKQS